VNASASESAFAGNVEEITRSAAWSTLGPSTQVHRDGSVHSGSERGTRASTVAPVGPNRFV